MATPKHDEFTKIAREHPGIETLETRGRDPLDFYEVGVASMKNALDAAYRAGQQELLTAAMALLEARNNQMVTPADWRRLRRAIRRAHKTYTRPRPCTRASVVFRGDTCRVAHARGLASPNTAQGDRVMSKKNGSKSKKTSTAQEIETPGNSPTESPEPAKGK